MNFLFANFNMIAFVAWGILFGLVVVRFLRPLWVRNISYSWLVAGAVTLHLLYGIFATWGQYVVWGKSEFTKILLSSVLSPDVPFPLLFEWTRPFFNSSHGYFAFYSFQHFFLSTALLFFVTGLFVLFFKIYAWYRPSNFEEGDIAIIALAFLIAGWQGVIVLVPLTFAFAVFFALLNIKFSRINQVSLSTAFLTTSPVAFLFAGPILIYLNLYTLLKI